MIKKIKKAFTLVELVVVIAIIAILSGVGVAVYIGITNKAKASADSEIVAQLNLKMKSEHAIGNYNKTAYEAYLDALDIGFNLKKMNPSTGGLYVWDEENDLFAVTKGSEIISQDKTNTLTATAHKQWIFVSEISETEKRSQMLTNDSYFLPVNVASGFDAGDNYVIPSVNYTGNTAKEVVIRTNGLEVELNIDAAADVVKHYGTVNKVFITKIAAHSYREAGNSAYVECASGRVVAEKGGSIVTVVLKETTESVKASVFRGDGSIENIYATSNTVVNDNNSQTTEHETLVIKTGSGTSTDWGNVVPVEEGNYNELEAALKEIQGDSIKELKEDLQSKCTHEHMGDETTCPDCGFVLEKKWSEEIAELADFAYSALITSYDIYSGSDLAIISRMIDSGKTFAGKTLNIKNDINLKNYLWSTDSDGSFNGTLVGNNFKISGLYIDTDSVNIGLFANVGALGEDGVANISNLTIDKASVKTTHGDNSSVGVLAGNIGFATIDNVTISNSTINAVDADQVAFITGNSCGDICNCTVENCIGVAHEQLAGIVGYFWAGSIDNCTVKSTLLDGSDRIGGLVGKFDCQLGNLGGESGTGYLILNNCTVDDCRLVSEANVGALSGQIMGDMERLNIKNNTLDATLVGANTFVFGQLRSGQSDRFVSALRDTDKVCGNKWTEKTSDKDSVTYTNGSVTVTINNTK